MTDLPRFYEGEIGKFNFSHLNEMMKRLDILLPVVQAAASGGGWNTKQKPMIFPVYAERTGKTTSNGAPKYRWWELTIVEDVVGWKDENTTDEGDTQLRAGGGGEDSEEDKDDEETVDLTQFGILPTDPRDENPDVDAFQSGFAIAVAIKSGNSEASSGGVKCLLFPLAANTSGPAYCMITGEPTADMVTVGDNERLCNIYPATLLRSSPGPEGEAALQVVDEEVTLADLNSSFENRPTITGAETTLSYRIYDTGTIFMATKIGEARYAFTHLCRFDVTCT